MIFIGQCVTILVIWNVSTTLQLYNFTTGMGEAKEVKKVFNNLEKVEKYPIKPTI